MSRDLAPLRDVLTEGERLGIPMPRRLLTADGDPFDARDAEYAIGVDHGSTIGYSARYYVGIAAPGSSFAPVAPAKKPKPALRTLRVAFSAEALIEVPMEWDDSMIETAVRGRWLVDAEARRVEVTDEGPDDDTGAITLGRHDLDEGNS